MNPSRRWVDFFRGRFRWLAPVALLALAPKCLLCLVAYAGLGAALLGGPEICGKSPDAMPAWVLWVSLFLVVLGVGGRAGLWRNRQPPR